jgi:hypothetical protein
LLEYSASFLPATLYWTTPLLPLPIAPCRTDAVPSLFLFRLSVPHFCGCCLSCRSPCSFRAASVIFLFHIQSW